MCLFTTGSDAQNAFRWHLDLHEAAFTIVIYTLFDYLESSATDFTLEGTDTKVSQKAIKFLFTHCIYLIPTLSIK